MDSLINNPVFAMTRRPILSGFQAGLFLFLAHLSFLSAFEVRPSADQEETRMALISGQYRPFMLLPASPNDDTLISISTGDPDSSLYFVVETDLASGSVERVMPVEEFGRFLQDFDGNTLYQVGTIDFNVSRETAVRTFDLRTMTQAYEVVLEFEATPIGVVDGFLLAHLHGEPFGPGPRRDQYASFDLATGKLLHVLEEADDLPFYLKPLLCRYQGEEQMLVYRAAQDGNGGTVGRLERVTVDGFVELHSETGVPNPRLDYQSTTPLISRDGEKIFVGNFMISRDLTEVVTFEGGQGQFYASDATGDRATNGDFYYTDPVLRLPDIAGGFVQEGAVFSENNRYLAYFDGFETQQLIIIDLQTEAPFPRPTPAPGEKFEDNPPVFTVGEIPDAISYVLTVTREIDGVEVERVEGGPALSLSNKLRQGFRYTWRIDGVTADGVVTGVEFPFEIGVSPDGDSSLFPPYALASDDTRLAILGAIIGITPTVQGGPASGLLQKVSLVSPGGFFGSNGFPGLNGESELAGRYYFVSDALGVGVYERDTEGCYQFQRTVESALGHPGLYYGNQMTSNGNEVFIASSNEEEGPVSIEIHRTIPELERIQTLVLPDLIDGGDSNLSFVRMAAAGDVLVISSGDDSRRQNGPEPRANLLIYVRDSSSGEWILRQTLEASPRFGALQAVSTDGRTIVWSGQFADTNVDEVRIFRRNEESAWDFEATLVGDPNLDEGFGMSVLVQGETLIVRSIARYTANQSQIIIFRRGKVGWLEQTKFAPERNSLPGGFGNQFDKGRSFARVGTTLFINLSSGVEAFDALFSTEDAPGFRSNPPSQVIPGRGYLDRLELADPAHLLELEEGPAWLSLSPVTPGVYQLEGVAPLTGAGGIVRLKSTSELGVSVYRVFELEVVSEDDFPVVGLSADRDSIFSGDSVVLRAEVEGAAPFTYEWFLNGETIEGETKVNLALVDARESQGGSYSVTVRNAAGEMTTDPVEIAVNRATAFGGNWTMAGGEAGHRNFVPAKLGNFDLEKIWSIQDRAVTHVAILDSKVYAISHTNRDGKLSAFDLSDGSILWDYRKPDQWIFHAPSVDESGVYLTGTPFDSAGTRSQVFSLDKASGAIRWARDFPNGIRPQGGHPGASVIGQGKIWIPVSSNSGIQAWTLEGGTRAADTGLQQLGDVVTPSLGGETGYVLSRNEIAAFGLEETSVKRHVSSGANPNLVQRDQVLPLQGTMTFVRETYEIYAFDLEKKRRVWGVKLPEDPAVGEFFKYPLVVSGSRVSTILGNRIRSYSVDQGEQLPDIDFPGEPLERTSPLLLNDVIIVPTTEGTHLISLATGELLKTVPEVGMPIYAEGHLIIIDQVASGTTTGMAVYRVEASDFLNVVTEELPDATEDESYRVELLAESSQPMEAITFELIDAPAWLDLSAEGVLSGTPLHQQGGDFEVGFRVSDGVNDSIEMTLPIKVIEVNDAPVIASIVIEMDEDSEGFQVLLATVVSDEESALEDLTVVLERTADQADLFSASIEDGILKIIPKADRFGSGLLKITVTDPEGLATGAEIPITIRPVDDAPRLVGEIPDMATDALGSDLILDLRDRFFDPDPEDVLKFEVNGNTNSAIFGEIGMSDEGVLQFEFAPYFWGVSEITVTATDPGGLALSEAFLVTLPMPKMPTGSQPGGISLNRRTGLFEQSFTVVNIAARAIGGFELSITGLTEGYRLYGFEGDKLSYLTPIEAGESVTLVLEYFSKESRSMPTPKLAVELILPAPIPPEEPVGVLPDRIVRLPDDGVLVEFSTLPGRRYQLQYSSDMSIWLPSPGIVSAGANRVQWLDQGPPKTACHPRDCPMRFYRVVLLPEVGE